MTKHIQPEFTGPELCRLTACEAVEKLKSGEIHSKDLLDACFERMAEVEPAVNATPTLCRERAEAAAQNLTEANENEPGWLAGLPITIKDLTRVEGVLKTDGTIGLANNIALESDPLVEKLESRGGVVVGKSNTPEMGAGGNTFNNIL